MKILVVCQFYYPENFVVTNISEKLASFGHDVTVLTGKPNYVYGHILKEYKYIKHEQINGVNVERVKLFARKKRKITIIANYLSFYFSSKRWVRKCKEKFDVVYSFSLSPVTILAAGNLYKKKHNVKHIVHCVDLWPESVVSTGAVRRNSLFYKILFKWSIRLYRGADKILIGSPSFEDYFKNVLHVNTELTYIPQCSLIEKADEKPYEFDNNFFNIVYCGNIGTLQNIDLIPEALKNIKSPVKFHIIGHGPLKDNLLNKIKEYDLDNKVIYYGPMNANKASLYFVNADAIYISLSNKGFVGKTIPNKIMMAMAFAKPLIAVVQGDGADVLKEAKGTIFAEENPESILNSIENIVSISNEKLLEMGQNNFKHYKKHFSQEIVSRLVENELLKN